MLRMRSRPSQMQGKATQMLTDSASETSLSSDGDRKHKSTSFFSLPGLFVGFTKGAQDADPARSPTSPLDGKVFSSLGSYLARSPRSPAGVDGPRKGWDRDRVGLGLVDALNEEAMPCGSSRILASPDRKNILLGSQRRIIVSGPKSSLDRILAEGSATSPRSLPKNYVISSHTRIGTPLLRVGPELPGARSEPGEAGKFQSCSADADGLFSARQKLSSGALHSESKNVKLVSSFVREANYDSSSGSLPVTHGFVGSLSASDIEQSEDYTCIISRGLNPKTTHIFGDCILESSDFVSQKEREEGRGTSWMVTCSEDPAPFPSEDFLRACYTCKKQLEGKDIYMYRGEKAFCSCSCRSQEILVEEEMEEPPTTGSSSGSLRSSSCEEVFLLGIDVAV